MAVNEYYQGFLAFVALMIGASYAFLQMLGGRPKGRIWARWVAPLYFASCVCLLSLVGVGFNPWFLLSLVAYKLSTHIGYGANTLWGKILRRSTWSLIRTACSLTFAFWTGAWTIYVSQVIVGLVMAVIWGVKNPQPAPREESIINFSNCFLVPLMVL